MSKIRLVIFDLDGTLVDSVKVVAFILNEMRASRGLDKLSEENYSAWVSIGGKYLVANALDLASENADEALNEFRRRYAELPTPSDSIYPGVIKAIESLKSAGLNICICTNKPRSLAEKVLSETALNRYFDFMVAGGDLQNSKPHPENIWACLSQFHVGPTESILVGDSLVDKTTAENSAVRFAFFEGGYGAGMDVGAINMKFSSYHDLCGLILSEMGSEDRLA